MDSEGFTAFKKAEKKYQLHQTEELKWSKGRLRRKGWVVRETDMSEVVDVHDEAEQEWPGISARSITESGRTHMVYSFDLHPGFYIIPQALCAEEQRDLVCCALEDYPDPPARTNLHKQYGDLPGLYKAAAQDMHLHRTSSVLLDEVPLPRENMHASSTVDFNDCTADTSNCRKTMPEDGHAGDTTCSCSELISNSTLHFVQQQMEDAPQDNSLQCINPQFPWCKVRAGPSAKSLLQRLRWSALGPQYNWSDRQYSGSDVFARLPDRLFEISTRVTRMLKIPFLPDAALVNYYHKGSTLGGHKDDAENDMNQPIISLSLGCPAIFLIGGDTKHVKPTPLLLQSGDVVVLSGQAREYFHGIPRIFTNRDNEMDKRKKSVGLVDSACSVSDLEEMLSDMRINISIRRVLP